MCGNYRYQRNENFVSCIARMLVKTSFINIWYAISAIARLHAVIFFFTKPQLPLGPQAASIDDAPTHRPLGL